MKTISWNYRGLGNSRAVRALGDLVKSRKPNMLFLMETLSNTDIRRKLSKKMGFEHCWSVDSQGRSGGLALMWDKSIHCEVVEADSNFIDVNILNNNVSIWRLTGFYGYPERTRRRDSWELLRCLAVKSSLPWFVFGDFNDMISEKDKKGNHKHPQAFLNGFKEVLDEIQLIELDLMRGRCTWEKSRGTLGWVRERIDRVFASASWWKKFPLCKLVVHHVIYSDHDPI
ncbi:uncharacterized protein LOC141685620 [Apium graveolens]|uniref:uncharacterized protein LOC141685620 n=1 Tax=Apium graveolens TaxID=4045 RepID=UPI003D7B5144